MKHLIHYHLMALRHKLSQKWEKTQDFFHRNWMKLAVILFAFQIISSKDIRVAVDLQSAPLAATHEALLEGMGTAQDVSLSSEDGHANPSVPMPANTFSNLGFILNPTYAKRKKVADRIVQYHNDKCKSYVKTFAPIAKKEMKKHGIPASIKLAQGLLESNAGDSRLAQANHNHFGIKCFSQKCKKGHCSNFMDDSHKDFFRKYESAAASYQAHSLFLQKDRYKHLKELGTQNYKGWAHGLKAAGYATDKQYAHKLIRIIEALELYDFDE